MDESSTAQVGDCQSTQQQMGWCLTSVGLEVLECVCVCANASHFRVAISRVSAGKRWLEQFWVRVIRGSDPKARMLVTVLANSIHELFIAQ